MSRLLIIGYGNPLRGDDGFGLLAAERLRQIIDDPEVEILAVQQLTPELMEPLSRTVRAILIDAAAEGAPGRLVSRGLKPDRSGAAGFTHYDTPEGLLAGCEALYGSVPAAVLYSVAAQSFEYGMTLTPDVERALEAVVMEVAAISRSTEHRS